MDDSVRRRVKQVCTKCEQEKLGSEFYRSRGRKNGLQGVCKPCMRTYQRSEAAKAHEGLMKIEMVVLNYKEQT